MRPPDAVSWYFDVISPFAYLQAEQMQDWLAATAIDVHPVVLGALLDRWETKGPAEIPLKRLQTYRSALSRAEALGIPFRFPPAHPFDPLPLLRLCIAAGGSFGAAREVLRFVWRDGYGPGDKAALEALAQRLGVQRPAEAMGSTEVKAKLRSSTQDAARQGVFGVPTLKVDGEFFWGEDATGMARRTWKQGRRWLSEGEWQRAGTLSVGVERKVRR